MLGFYSFGVGAAFTALGAKILIPIVVSIIIVPVMQLLKTLWGWLDRAPSPVKNAAVLVLAALGTTIAPVIAAATGITVPADVTTWDQHLVSALLSAALGIAFKKSQQLKEADATLSAIDGAAAARTPAFPFDIPPANPNVAPIKLANGDEWAGVPQKDDK